jgi:hypothetical protein
MQWALRRQFLFALGVLVLFGALGTFVYFSYIYKAPTCFDGVQNQGEEGIDCDGSCALLCKAPNVSVVWARPVQAASGVYHAVALIRNPDTTSAGSFTYEISLFDAENILVARRPGTFAIAPGEVAPLFEANIVTGERIPSRVFVDIAPGQFVRTERASQLVRILNWDLDEATSRLTATVQNNSNAPVSGATVTALLFNTDDILVNASQTLSGPLEPNERKTITFTWQEPFSETISRVDIVPREVTTK